MPKDLGATLYLQFKDIEHQFNSKRIFKVANFSAPECGLLVLRGPNGSGKTSLIRALATLLIPSSGTILCKGDSIHGERSNFRSQLGFCSAKEAGFFPRLTGQENLLLFGTLFGCSKTEIQNKIRILCEYKILNADILATPYLFASSGMRQCLGVARVFLKEHRLYLLDEPTRALDSQIIEGYYALLDEKAKSSLIIMASHREREWKMANILVSLPTGEVTHA